MKPQFFMTLRDGTRAKSPTSYTPIKAEVGINGAMKTFALHRSSGGEWVISDPVAGGRVCRVFASYKGMPCASGAMSTDAARREGATQLTQMISKVGAVPFATRLHAMRAKYAP